VRLTLWIESWQHGCCGESFGIGSTLGWTLAGPDEYVDSLFAPDLSVHVDHVDDPHTHFKTPETIGTVTAIRSVRVRHAPDPNDERVRVTVPGSAELTEVERSNGDEMRPREFAGYLVEIQVADAE
jgi:Family of unknown function (DUF6578)